MCHAEKWTVNEEEEEGEQPTWTLPPAWRMRPTRGVKILSLTLPLHQHTSKSAWCASAAAVGGARAGGKAGGALSSRKRGAAGWARRHADRMAARGHDTAGQLAWSLAEKAAACRYSCAPHTVKVQRLNGHRSGELLWRRKEPHLRQSMDQASTRVGGLLSRGGQLGVGQQRSARCGEPLHAVMHGNSRLQHFNSVARVGRALLTLGARENGRARITTQDPQTRRALVTCQHGGLEEVLIRSLRDAKVAQHLTRRLLIVPAAARVLGWGRVGWGVGTGDGVGWGVSTGDGVGWGGVGWGGVGRGGAAEL